MENLRTVHLSARTVALDAPCTQGSTVSLRPSHVICHDDGSRRAHSAASRTAPVFSIASLVAAGLDRIGNLELVDLRSESWSTDGSAATSGFDTVRFSNFFGIAHTQPGSYTIRSWRADVIEGYEFLRMHSGFERDPWTCIARYGGAVRLCGVAARFRFSQDRVRGARSPRRNSPWATVRRRGRGKWGVLGISDHQRGRGRISRPNADD